MQRRLRQWKQVSQGWHSQVGPGSGRYAWEITAYSNVFQTTGNEIYLVTWYRLEKLNKQNRIVWNKMEEKKIFKCIAPSKGELVLYSCMSVLCVCTYFCMFILSHNRKCMSSLEFQSQKYKDI